jgi:hypothetical protein
MNDLSKGFILPGESLHGIRCGSNIGEENVDIPD